MDEVKAAAERLSRIDKGETPEEVYATDRIDALDRMDEDSFALARRFLAENIPLQGTPDGEASEA